MHVSARRRRSSERRIAIVIESLQWQGKDNHQPEQLIGHLWRGAAVAKGGRQRNTIHSLVYPAGMDPSKDETASNSSLGSANSADVPLSFIYVSRTNG